MLRKILISCTLFSFSASTLAGQETLDLRFLSTSDLHSYISQYDYYNDSYSQSYGLVGLIGEIDYYRSQVKNSFLVDTGDTLVGNPLGNFIAQSFKPTDTSWQSAIICAMNKMEYDAAALGNHEFDYGLELVKQSYQAANFPIITSNIEDVATGQSLFQAYSIQDKKVFSSADKSYQLKIAYIGLTPPQTMDLNRDKLTGKVLISDQLAAARKAVQEAKLAGTDIVIALAHSGLNTDDYSQGMEDVTYHLAQLADVDGILFGHSHKRFPAQPALTHENINNKDGLINGKPAAQPGKWGEALSGIDLQLSRKEGKWVVTSGKGFVVDASSIAENKEQKDRLASCLNTTEQALKQDLNEVIGQVSTPLSNQYNFIGNDAVYALGNASILAYLTQHLKSNDKILVANAPATAIADPNYQIDIKGPDINKKDLSKLVYPATLSALRMSGAEIKEWLEISASIYKEPNDKSNQLLKTDALTYLYYPIEGVTYEINIDHPSIYNQQGDKILGTNNKQGRIENLRYQGELIKDSDNFILMASSYAPYFSREMKKKRQFLDIGSPNNKQLLSEYLKNNKLKPIVIEDNWKVILNKKTLDKERYSKEIN